MLEVELILDDFTNILFKAQSSQDVFDALAETLSTIASWGEAYLWQNDCLELKTYFHTNEKYVLMLLVRGLLKHL